MRRSKMVLVLVVGACLCAGCKGGGEGGRKEGAKPSAGAAQAAGEQSASAPSVAAAEAGGKQAAQGGAQPEEGAKTEPAAGASSTSPEEAKLPGSGSRGEPKSAEEKKLSDVLPPPGAPSSGQAVVAWKDGTRIDAEAFRLYLSRLPSFQRREYSSLEKKKELLRNLIQFETLAELARTEGLELDPEVVLAAKTEMVKKLLHVKFGDVGTVDVTSEELAARYERDKGSYNRPERLRASHIFIKDEARAREVLEELRKSLAEPGGYPRRVFREFVRKYSEDETTKRRGGDLLFFSQEGVEKGEEKVERAVAEAAFAMQNLDQVSDLVKGEGGWHILLLTNRRERVEKPLQEVQEEIRTAIAMEKLDRSRRDFMDGLVDFEKWNMELRELDKVEVESEPSEPGVKARVDSIKGKESPTDEGTTP